MFRSLVTLAICLTGLIAFADDIPPNVKKLIEQGEIRRKERLSELEGGLQIMKQRLHEEMRGQGGLGTGVPANAIAKEHTIQRTQQRIDGIQAQMDAVREQKVFYPNITLKTAQVGDIGMLVDSFGSGITGKVAKVIDDKNMIVAIESQSVWMQTSTKGMKAGKHLTLDMPLEITGTTTHKSVGGGSKSFFTVKPFQFPDVEIAPRQAMRTTAERSR